MGRFGTERKHWTKPTEVEARRGLPQALSAEVLLHGLWVSDYGKTISVTYDDVLAAFNGNQLTVIRLLVIVHADIVPYTSETRGGTVRTPERVNRPLTQEES
ncbi:hypothetical protein Pve01_78540 [Planomonospora venezuelensis]|nr:hypothetical protein Pve01_78540 [Planomonospora venezuelensis]